MHITFVDNVDLMLYFKGCYNKVYLAPTIPPS